MAVVPTYGSFISRRLEIPAVIWCHIPVQGLFLDESKGSRSLNAVIEERQNITTQDCSFFFFFHFVIINLLIDLSLRIEKIQYEK